MLNIKSDQKELLNEEILQGLLFIENLRNIRFEKNQLNVIIKGFWADNIITKECLIDNKINHLESFSIARNNTFLNKVVNNHLIIELHQRDNNEIIGIAKLPLHQFYIAFKDFEITNRLSKEFLPVISIDDWVPVINPTTRDCYAYIKSLLAMGTQEQMDHLKEKHDLTSLLLSSKCSQFQNINCDITTKQCSDNCSKQKLNGIPSNHLENFIESLIHQRNLNTLTKNGVSNVDIEKNSKKLQTRKTSDLLDTLSEALATPPIENDMFSLCFNQFSTSTIDIPKTCKTLIEIERATDLPRNTMKIGNKKISKRSTNGNGKRKQSRFITEEEPSAYVTFHAAAGYGQMVKSHEGFVYATNVIERNCNPIWGKKFEVPIPLELFTNVEKRFILKIWRKVSTDLAQCRYQPLPMEDVVIGFSSVDMNSLKTENQLIEWYNIVDHNGRIHGRLKIKIKLLEDLKNLIELNKKNSCSIETSGNSMNWTCNNIDLNNTPLSRAIKRKFTELEEITERLKARLLGVTGDLDNNDDDESQDEDNDNDHDDDEKDPILQAQLDEFEHDLNTVCEEDDENDGYEKYKNLNWLLSIQNHNENADENIQVQTKHDDSVSLEKIQTINDVLNKADLCNTISSQIQTNLISESNLKAKQNI